MDLVSDFFFWLLILKVILIGKSGLWLNINLYGDCFVFLCLVLLYVCIRGERYFF